MVPYDSLGFLRVPYGSLWFLMVPNGSLSFLIVHSLGFLFGFLWLLTVFRAPKANLFHKGPYGFLRVGSFWFPSLAGHRGLNGIQSCLKLEYAGQNENSAP